MKIARSNFKILLIGGMIEHQAEVLPAALIMAKQILSRLGDYSAMTEEDDVLSNIQALAGLLISVGKMFDVLLYTTRYLHNSCNFFMRDRTHFS